MLAQLVRHPWKNNLQGGTKMKTATVLGLFVLILLMPVLSFASSCGGEEGCPLNPAPDYFYIQFNISGEEYTIGEPVITLNFAYLPYTIDDPLAVLDDANHIIIVGSNCGGMNTMDANINLTIDLFPSTAGVYVGTYTDEGTATGTCGVHGPFSDGQEDHFYGSTDSTVTITSYGDLMGDVEGTFSCTLEYVDTPTPSFGSPLVLSGSFRVKSAQPE
jgi:hypothetical protein